MFPRFSTSTCNVILRRHSLLEVPRRRIHNAIAHAMSICVALGNKVMDTRLPQPVGCGDKYDACSTGRSMIEMLGVLAIIAVLTVGGIAGYSKAMEMWKINKLTEEYSMLIFGMMSHIDDARKLTVYREGEFGDTTYMNDIAEAENLIPPTWTKNDTRGTIYVTELGNLVGIMSRNSKLTIELGFYNYEAFAADAMSPKFCQSIYDKIIVPLNSSLYVAEKYNNGLGTISNYYGYDYCANGKKCIKSLTPVQIKTLCKNCNVDRCSVVIRF